MEGSLGVSLYLSRIQQEIIAEGGTQTSPSLRYNHGSLGMSLYLSRIQQEIIAEGGTQTSPSLRYNH
jgi:hypothetical protein